MATKPTDPVPTWATSATGISRTVDPGAGVRADGWDVDDRPPSGWWNWMWNLICSWLVWAELQSDEHATAISDLVDERQEITRALAGSLHIIWSADWAEFGNIRALRDGCLGVDNPSSVTADGFAAAIQQVGFTALGTSPPFLITPTASGSDTVICNSITKYGGSKDYAAIISINGTQDGYIADSGDGSWTKQGAVGIIFSLIGGYSTNGTVVNLDASVTPVLYYSTDNLLTWTGAGTPMGTNKARFIRGWSGAGFSGFIIGGENGDYATSPDGITWTDRVGSTPDAGYELSDVIYSPANSKWYMCGRSATGTVRCWSTPDILTPTWTFETISNINGVNWPNRSTTSELLPKLARSEAPGGWIAMATAMSFHLYNPHDAEWVSTVYPIGPKIVDIDWDNGQHRFVVCSNQYTSSAASEASNSVLLATNTIPDF